MFSALDIPDDLSALDVEARDALIAKARAYAYCVLELLNADERPRIGMRAHGWPNIDWVHIPSYGEWIYQQSKYAALPPFYISPYAQFLTFADAPDCKDDR